MSHHSDLIGELAAQIDVSNARTQRICAEQPDLRHTYSTLLRLEKSVHGHGWDQPAAVFLVFKSMHNGKIRCEHDANLTDLLRQLPMPPAEALTWLASSVESVRAYAFSLDDESVRDPHVVMLMRCLPEYASRLRDDPTADLIEPTAPGWPFFGFGLLAESYSLLGTSEDLVDAANRREAYKHPDRMETRDLNVVGRDGLHWWVSRYRRTNEVVLPRMCVISTSDDSKVVGTIANALSRLTAAVASNLVPVIPDSAVADLVSRGNAGES